MTNLSFRVDELSRFTYSFVYWDNFFSNLELKGINDYCISKQEFEDAKVIAGEKNNSLNSNDNEEEKLNNLNLSVRKSKVKMFNYDQDNHWIFEKLKSVGELLNDEFYRFNLTGFNYFQYTEYDESYEGKYDFHIDVGLGGNVPFSMQVAQRKLSVVLFLSDSEEYEGGQFEITTGDVPEVIEQKKGRVIAFPSWLLHRVTPVTKGNRKSLVYWICGPKFK